LPEIVPHIIKPRRSLPGWSVRPNEQPPRQALGLTRPCRPPRDRRFGLRPQSGTRGVLPYAAPLVAGAPPPLVAIAGPRGLFGTGRKIFRLFSLALVSVHSHQPDRVVSSPVLRRPGWIARRLKPASRTGRLVNFARGILHRARANKQCIDTTCGRARHRAGPEISGGRAKLCMEAPLSLYTTL
jgi:hypothetical protein